MNNVQKNRRFGPAGRPLSRALSQVIDLTMDDVPPREERAQRRADEAGTVTRRVRLRGDVRDGLLLDIIYSLSVSRFSCFQCSGTTLILS